jgi:hypothetical protein
MSDLPIKSILKEEALQLKEELDITLKLDGTLVKYINGKLMSPRCERTERYQHITDILIKNNFPNCIGEMFIDKPGSNVFDISKKENWSKAKFMPFDLLDTSLPYLERAKILDNKIVEVNNPSIFRMIRFSTFKEGWDYVVKNKSEGLVLRNNISWYKCKLLQEVKIEIVKHIPNKVKGTFVLKNGSHISGTSVGFVNQFLEAKKKGLTPIAEIEFPFLTSDGRYFQPRLRQITEVSQ